MDKPSPRRKAKRQAPAQCIPVVPVVELKRKRFCDMNTLDYTPMNHDNLARSWQQLAIENRALRNQGADNSAHVAGFNPALELVRLYLEGDISDLRKAGLMLQLLKLGKVRAQTYGSTKTKRDDPSEAAEGIKVVFNQPPASTTPSSAE